ncbi:TonB family protein [bacterium]
MKKYVGAGSRLSKTGVLVSILIHALVLAIPISLIVVPSQRDKEKKIELVFEKPKPPPKQKSKPQPKPAPVPKPAEDPPPKSSPIESEIVEDGGIDIPTGPVYEEIYVPPAPVCGNGEVEENEQCDDGNTDDGDGCSSSCAVETACGNGVLDAGEVCDDGNTAGGDECSADCSRKIDRDRIIGDYQRELFKIIEKNKKYPPAARRRGLQGGVGVGFTILSDGSHKNLRVTKTSGNSLLDDSAVKTIESIPKFPPPPADLDMGEMSIELTIVFKLR